MSMEGWLLNMSQYSENFVPMFVPMIVIFSQGEACQGDFGFPMKRWLKWPLRRYTEQLDQLIKPVN